MKLAFVNQPWNPFLPPVRSGSIAIWNDRVARVLARDAALRVVVLGATRDTKTITREDAGVRFRAVPLGMGPRIERLRERLGLDRDPRTPRLLDPGVYPGFARRLLAALVDEQPDVVHLHNLVQLLPLIRGSLPKARLVAHLHCEWLSQLEHAWMADLARHADLILGCSEHVAATIRSAHPRLASRCHAVPNGVDIAAFTPSPEAATPPRAILFVGRISPEKGLHVLIPAFGELCVSRPDLELRIVGPEAQTPRAILVDLSVDPRVRALERFYDLDYLAELRRLAAPFGDRVRFLGAAPQDEVPQHYARAHVVVQPSLYESFGVPIVEAMASGRAVVACRAGGMTELIEDGHDGLLAEPADPISLAQALARLLDDAALRRQLADRGVTTARERFAWEHVARAVREIHTLDLGGIPA